MNQDLELLKAQRHNIKNSLRELSLKLKQTSSELAAAKKQNNAAATQVLSDEYRALSEQSKPLIKTLNNINLDILGMSRTSSLSQDLFQDRRDLVKRLTQYRTKRNYLNTLLETEPLAADQAQAIINQIKGLDAEIAQMTKEFWKVSDELKTVKKDYTDTFQNQPRLDPATKHKVWLQQRVRDEGSKTESSTSRISKRANELLVIADTLNQIENDIGSLNDEVEVLEDTSKKLDRIKKKRKQVMPPTV